MNAMAKLGAGALLLSLSVGSASAISVTSNVCVTNASPWLQVGPPPPPSNCPSPNLPSDPALPVAFALPEANPVTPGDFIFNRTFAAAPGYYTILDPDGTTASDYILFGNNASGDGEIHFYPYPTAPPSLAGYTNDGVLCVADVSGCVGSFVLPDTVGDFILIEPGSRGDTYFDPFGAGFDTRADIRFSTIPEPSTLFLSALLLGVLFCGRRWLRA